MNEHSFVRSIHRYLPPEVFRVENPRYLYGRRTRRDVCADLQGYCSSSTSMSKPLPKTRRHADASFHCPNCKSNGSSVSTAQLPPRLIIGVENTAVILFRDFAQNISRMHYLEQNITRQDVANWIYSTTHSGRTHGRKASHQPVKNLRRIWDQKKVEMRFTQVEAAKAT